MMTQQQIVEASTRARRTYSDTERRKILKDLAKHGLAETARKHKVPKPTICNWKRKAREEAATTSVKAAPTKTRSPAPHPTAATASRPVSTATPTTGKQSNKATDSNKPTGSPAKRPTRRTARRYTPSERARALEHAATHGVSATAKELGISRYSLYEWQRQLERAARGEGPSPTSGPDPSDIEAQRDREILGEWKKHPGLGPSQIRNQLRRRGIKVGVATVRRVMTDAGYRPPKIKRDPHNQRYEAVRPNGMWHLDFVHRHINKANTFTFILIDDYSRFVVGHGVDDAERSKMVLRTFEEAVSRHGKPEAVMNDRGSAFWSWRGVSKFTALLTELGIDQVVAVNKEHNGKVEVFNANIAKEFFNQHRFYDLSEMQRRLVGHLRWYNHGRTHHALGGLLVPADRYYGRADEVLARIEAGALREGDELGLSDRGLELFKVVSKGGVPELWLCGQQLAWPKIQ